MSTVTIDTTKIIGKLPILGRLPCVPGECDFYYRKKSNFPLLDASILWTEALVDGIKCITEAPFEMATKLSDIKQPLVIVSGNWVGPFSEDAVVRYNRLADGVVLIVDMEVANISMAVDDNDEIVPGEAMIIDDETVMVAARVNFPRFLRIYTMDFAGNMLSSDTIQ